MKSRRFVFAVSFAVVVVAVLFVRSHLVQAQNAPVVRVVPVQSVVQLQQALREARPGTRIEIAPGDYAGGIYFKGLHGTAGRPIVITGADPKNPPHFKGGGNVLHLAAISHVELSDLILSGAPDNGLNLDDGAQYGTPSHHIVLRRLQVRDIGPDGNHDGIKLSGLEDFRIEECRLDRWGRSGSGIDMVGCHRGVLENNQFRHSAEAEAGGAYAVQAKGGCRDITIRRNHFENVGARSINIGGSTGFTFFRPPLSSWPPEQERYEAKNILIEGNTFIGSTVPLAFVGVDGAIARFNTIYRPRRWAMRILQETREPGFASCRNGVVEDNIVVFRSHEWMEGGVNIGPNTAPQTFRFARNWWFCEDNPARSKPTLPTPEVGGVYGQDPQFCDPRTLDLHLQPDSPALKYGAQAMTESKP
ncbi:MAG: hypothetical protein JWN98_1291 [Abditibacteriota bacterium]|nr:hypothetical protein [Abditibacteriota bacterium]